MQSALVVSIHDVSPLTRERVAEMLADLAKAGVLRTSLLVIPNHHHKAPMAADPAFAVWLHELEAEGHEIVAHGYFHKRPPTEGALAGKLMTEVYTAGEGEFFDLTQTAALERLEKGLQDFKSMGFTPCGFIAPAWLLGSEAEKAVTAAGFQYTTRLGTFKDLGNGSETRSQSLVWSVRSGWRRLVSRGWNATLAWRLRQTPLFRVGLHPPDWDHPAIRTQCLQLIRAALAGREAITYEEWLERERSKQ